MSRSDRGNHANQLNPNNDAYWQSRSLEERPDDWEERVREEASAEQEVPKGANPDK